MIQGGGFDFKYDVIIKVVNQHIQYRNLRLRFGYYH